MMRTTMIASLSGLIGLTLVACSGATTEPVDQSAQAETAHLGAAPSASSGAPDAQHERRNHRGPHTIADLVQRFDKNADGQLQVSELPNQMQEYLGKADSNADGVISAEELAAGKEKMRAEHLAKIDTDHDGQVSPEERKAAFEQFAQRRFEKMDANKDGALTAQELGDKRWAHLSVADADKDGRVTRDEIKTAVAAGTLKFPHHGRGAHGHDHAGGADSDGVGNAPPADAPSGT